MDNEPGAHEGSRPSARSRPMTPFQQRLGRVTVQYMTGLNNVVYRLSAGRVAGNVPSGAPILLLTTVGRRSGRLRTVPLLYLPDGDDLVVVASRGGMTAHPAWYLNLLVHPEVTVDTGRHRRIMRAHVATTSERARNSRLASSTKQSKPRNCSRVWATKVTTRVSEAIGRPAIVRELLRRG